MTDLYRLISPARTNSDRSTALVLLHGLGSNEADLFSLAPELDSRLTVISLRAPRTYGLGGYAWFDIEWTETELRFNGEQAVEAVKVIEENLAEVRASYDRLILGGFSQGAMMSAGVAVAGRLKLDGLVLMSGALVPELAGNADLSGLPTFQSHGLLDPVLPIGLGRNLRNLMLDAGATVAYHEYPMAHEVSLACLRDLNRWLVQLLDESGNPPL